MGVQPIAEARSRTHVEASDRASSKRPDRNASIAAFPSTATGRQGAWRSAGRRGRTPHLTHKGAPVLVGCSRLWPRQAGKKLSCGAGGASAPRVLPATPGSRQPTWKLRTHAKSCAHSYRYAS